MENRGEDGIWELSVLATCGPSSQNSSLFSRIHCKKLENRVKDCIWHPRIYPTCRTNSQNLPRFSRIHQNTFLKICNFSYLLFLTKTSQPHKETRTSCSCKFLVYLGRVSSLIETSLRSDYS